MATRIKDLSSTEELDDNTCFAVDPKDGTTRSITAENVRKYIGASVISSDYNYDNNSWYRVWSDGWCEQGGMHTDIRANKVEFELKIKQLMYANAVSTYGSHGDDNDFGVGCAHVVHNENHYLAVYLTFNNSVDLGGSPNMGIYWEAKGIVDESKFPALFKQDV